MTETRNYYAPHKHNTFGGYVCLSDFNTDYRGNDQKESSIAKHIESDMRFDRQCKLNTINRDKKKNMKEGK